MNRKFMEMAIIGLTLVLTSVVPVFAVGLPADSTLSQATLKENSTVSSSAIVSGDTSVFETADQETVATIIDSSKEKIKITPQKTGTTPVPVIKEPVSAVQKTVQPATPAVAKILYMESTAYSWLEPGSETGTATGVDLTTNPRVIAVDPNVIPLGTKVYVEGYGEAIAADTGGLIKGNIIDVHVGSLTAMTNWGRHQVKVIVYAS